MTVSDAMLQAFAGLATPTIANALDDVAFEGVMQGLTQMVPGGAASAVPSRSERSPVSAVISNPKISRLAT